MAGALCASAAGAQERKVKASKGATLFISPAGKPFHADAGQPYPVSVWFAEADTDHDGKLTREEFRADFEAFFKTLDVDHNGVIDGIETARYEEQVAPEVLPRLAQTQRGDFPTEADGGAHGRSTRRLVQPQSRRGQEDIEGAPEFSLFNVSEPVSGSDLNFDGKISLEEFMAAADRRFDQLDVTRQGYLTLKGLPQTPEQVAVEGKHKPQR